MTPPEGTEDIQTLVLAARLYPLVLSGEKTQTIRWREQRMEPGPMRYVCEGDPARQIIVRVIGCTDMALSEAAAFVGKADEWPDAVMLAGMREHYPAITLSDVVQVIEHTPPEAIAQT